MQTPAHTPLLPHHKSLAVPICLCIDILQCIVCHFKRDIAVPENYCNSQTIGKAMCHGCNWVRQQIITVRRNCVLQKCFDTSLHYWHKWCMHGLLYLHTKFLQWCILINTFCKCGAQCNTFTRWVCINYTLYVVCTFSARSIAQRTCSLYFACTLPSTVQVYCTLLVHSVRDTSGLLSSAYIIHIISEQVSALTISIINALSGALLVHITMCTVSAQMGALRVYTFSALTGALYF